MKKVAMLSVCFWLACAGMPGGNGSGGSGGDGSGGNGSGGNGGAGSGGVAGSGGGGSAGGGGGSGGGGGGDVPEYVSGSRLRARVVTSSDGAKQLLGWHDNMLNIDCAFNLASDGQQRCLPQTYAIIGTYFGDSGCAATKLAYLPASYVAACPPSLASWSEMTTTCTSLGYPASKVHLYAVAGQYNGAMVWTGTPANCISEMTANLTSVVFYSIGSETAATTYASGTISVE